MHSAARPATRRSLSEGQRWLIDLLSEIRFGAVEALHICGGEPALEPPPKTTREWRIGDDRQAGPKPPRSDDFTLKAEQAELLEILHQIQDGVVQRIGVRHGLPYHVAVTEASWRSDPLTRSRAPLGGRA